MTNAKNLNMTEMEYSTDDTGLGEGPWTILLLTSVLLKSRVANHIQRSIASLSRVSVSIAGRIVVFSSSDKTEGWADRVLAQLVSDQRLRRFVSSVFFCDRILSMPADIVCDREICNSGLTYRIQAYSKTLHNYIGSKLPLSVALHPVNFDRLLYAVETRPNEILLSSSLGRSSYFAGHEEIRRIKNEPAKVCRAYLKMFEVAHIVGRDAITEHMFAVDIGASPGGWTEFLSSRVAKVASIDPSTLDKRVLARPNVFHLQKRAEDALPDLKALMGGNLSGIHICVIDMNRPPAFTLDCVMKIAPLMLPGSLLVVTLKFNHGKIEKRHEVANVFVQSLLPFFDRGQIEWLYSNQMLERTVLAYRTHQSIACGELR